MSNARRSFRSTLPELAVQAVLVVFAVVVALAVEDWWNERELQEFADRARTAVVTEISANLEEYRSTGPALKSMAARLTEVVREEDISLLNRSLSFTLPEFSSSAWRTAQSSQAAQRFDYDWVIQVSRAHEVHDYYSSIADRLIDAMSEIIGRDPTIEHVEAIYGHVLILSELHEQVQDRLEALLEGEG